MTPAGRPMKGSEPRNIRKELLLTPTDLAALDRLRLPGESHNDVVARLIQEELARIRLLKEDQSWIVR